MIQVTSSSLPHRSLGMVPHHAAEQLEDIEEDVADDRGRRPLEFGPVAMEPLTKRLEVTTLELVAADVFDGLFGEEWQASEHEGTEHLAAVRALHPSRRIL